MREIKFRGYDGMDWIYSNSIDYEKETDTWRMLSYKDDEWMVVNRVGQYTGLKDRNGKAVFEGDILSDEAYTNIKGEIYFDEGCFKVNLGNDRPLFDDLQDYELEIIGNIYENPELI